MKNKKLYIKPTVIKIGSIEEITTWSACNSEFYFGGESFLCHKRSRGKGPADFGS